LDSGQFYHHHRRHSDEVTHCGVSGSYPAMNGNYDPFVSKTVPQTEYTPAFSCLPPFPPAGFASPPSAASRSLGTMLALTPHGVGRLPLRCFVPLGLIPGRDAPAAFDGLAVSRPVTPAFLTPRPVRSPRVMRAASGPRRPAQPVRARAGKAHCPRTAGGFTIASRLAATHRPYLRVHSRYGSALCLPALRTPPRGGALPLAIPSKGHRREPDFNRQVAHTAGRTSWQASA